MHGIMEAITEANGWNMAGLGILVVFSSLVVLSILISQLHRVLAIWDKGAAALPPGVPESGAASTNVLSAGRNNMPKITLEERRPPPAAVEPPPHPDPRPENIARIAAIWATRIEELRRPFDLADLYRLAKQHDLPHPHLTITWMRRQNILTPDENRLFTFHHEREEA